MKSCAFPHDHFFKLLKVVENLFKKAYGEKLIEKTYVVGTRWTCLIELIEAILMCTYNILGNSNVYIQYMLLKIRKKTIWKFTFSKNHVHCLYLF